MSTTASTITVIAALVALMGVQTFWIARALDSLRDAIGEVRNEMRDLRGDVSTLERTIVREHGERITRLEERLP